MEGIEKEGYITQIYSYKLLSELIMHTLFEQINPI